MFELKIELPLALRGVFFSHRWENSRIWALSTPTTVISMKALEWHLDLPVWTTVGGEPLFDLAPRSVLSSPTEHPKRWERIGSVDLSHPLEMFKNGERWVIVDGYHRLARLKLEGASEARVRMHPDDAWDSVSSGG